MVQKATSSTLTDDANPINARDNAYETLKKYPDIAGMVGLWSYNGPDQSARDMKASEV
jgi:hypothetical protein